MNISLREKLTLGTGCLTACAGIYLLTNQISFGFDNRAQMFFDWELNIPLIPCFILVYFSFYFLLVLAFLACRNKVDLHNLTGQFLFCAIVGALIFLAFPGELGYTRAQETGLFKPIYNLLFALDNPTNLYPSLHVAFSYVAFRFVLGQARSALLKLLTGLWFVGICSSVVLVHQHHLFDIVSGLALAIVARRLI